MPTDAPRHPTDGVTDDPALRAAQSQAARAALVAQLRAGAPGALAVPGTDYQITDDGTVTLPWARRADRGRLHASGAPPAPRTSLRAAVDVIPEWLTARRTLARERRLNPTTPQPDSDATLIRRSAIVGGGVVTGLGYSGMVSGVAGLVALGLAGRELQGVLQRELPALRIARSKMRFAVPVDAQGHELLMVRMHAAQTLSAAVAQESTPVTAPSPAIPPAARPVARSTARSGRVVA